MKTKIYIQIILVLICLPAFSQVPAWQWAKGATGNFYDLGFSISVDATGNSYITGNFGSPTITIGNITLTNSGSYDFLIAKYDPSGNVLWVKSAGGTDPDRGSSIGLDANGNCYVTGSFFSPTITFDGITLTQPGYFVVKYDSAGNVVWAKGATGNAGDEGTGISVEANGSFYVTGNCGGASIIFDNDTLTNEEIFIVSYDAAGNVLWAKSAGGPYEDHCYNINADASGNSYVTGCFRSDTLIFGSSVLLNQAPGSTTNDFFIAKYDPAGNTLWAKSTGGPSDVYGLSVGTDANGNSYVTGIFYEDTLNFDGTILINSGAWEVFIVKYDAAGNALWAKSAGGALDDISMDIHVDAIGNSYIIGYFKSDSIIFGNTTLLNCDFLDAELFVTKYDPSGNILWAKGIQGFADDLGFGIDNDASGNSYILGIAHSDSLSFGNMSLTNPVNVGLLVARLSSTTGIAEAYASPDVVRIFPDPVTDQLNISVNNNEFSEIILYDMTARNILQHQFINTASINAQQLSKGIYLYELRNKNGVIKKGKFVKE